MLPSKVSIVSSVRSRFGRRNSSQTERSGSRVSGMTGRLGLRRLNKNSLGYTALLAVTAGQFCQPLVRAQDDATIKVNVRLVRVLATVKDSAGALVGSLDKQDFEVTDNG